MICCPFLLIVLHYTWGIEIPFLYDICTITPHGLALLSFLINSQVWDTTIWVGKVWNAFVILFGIP